MGNERIIDYVPDGVVCSYRMVIKVKGDIIEQLDILGGCHGCGQGISALVKGMQVDDVVEKLSGIRCKASGTSCPDQIARALQYRG